MKIDAQGLLSFLNKFQFTNRIDDVVWEERDGQLMIIASTNDLICLGIYDEQWFQENPLGVRLKHICNFLRKQEEIDISFSSDRIILKGKGTLEYKPINPIYLTASRPEFTVDPFTIMDTFSNRAHIEKADKAIIQSLLATTQSNIVTFTSSGLYSGEDNEHIVRFDFETGLKEDEKISVKKDILVEVMKKYQDFNLKTVPGGSDSVLISSDDVFYVIRKEVE
jgi:hypothetical protein